MLELEITESVVMKDEAWAEQALVQLKELGVLLAIDDFGTGYSSFGRLRNFAVDRLKIDRSFMTSLIECSDDRAITAAIIAMSRSLRISVTAEGVRKRRAFCSVARCRHPRRTSSCPGPRRPPRALARSD
jgi:EAL domain-containing protein (putative c-di-GMP-specific phosphodiesterase class I)